MISYCFKPLNFQMVCPAAVYSQNTYIMQKSRQFQGWRDPEAQITLPGLIVLSYVLLSSAPDLVLNHLPPLDVPQDLQTYSIPISSNPSGQTCSCTMVPYNSPQCTLLAR